MTPYMEMKLTAEASERGRIEAQSQLDAALAREAALREELAKSRAAFNEELDGVKYTRRKFRQERDALQQRLNNEGDPIGGDPAGGYKNDLARVNSAFDELAASVGFSEARLDQTGDSPVDCANQLQQRLTDAENLLSRVYRAYGLARSPLWQEVGSALKPAEVKKPNYQLAPAVDALKEAGFLRD